MNRFKIAALRLASKIPKTIRGLLPDLHVYVGIVLVAYGAGQAPGWIGAVLAPIIIGLGLVWIVSAGAEPVRRR